MVLRCRKRRIRVDGVHRTGVISSARLVLLRLLPVPASAFRILLFMPPLANIFPEGFIGGDQSAQSVLQRDFFLMFQLSLFQSLCLSFLISGKVSFSPIPGEQPIALLRVQILCCEDLLPKDRGGTSDPYV